MTLTQYASSRGETLYGFFSYCYRRKYQCGNPAVVRTDTNLHMDFPSYIPEYVELWLVARKVNGFAHKEIPRATADLHHQGVR